MVALPGVAAVVLAGPGGGGDRGSGGGGSSSLGEPPEGEELAASDPRRLVAETLSYLRNNQERMAYPRYRQTGLPVTSSLVESLVGSSTPDSKAGRAYWDRLAGDGGEAMLQLRAAVLSEDERLARHFAQRPGNPYRRRYPAKKLANVS